MMRGPILREARVEDASEIARLAGELGYITPIEAMRKRLTILVSLPFYEHMGYVRRKTQHFYVKVLAS